MDFEISKVVLTAGNDVGGSGMYVFAEIDR